MSRVRVFFEQRLVGMIDVDKRGPGFTYDRDWIELERCFSDLDDDAVDRRSAFLPTLFSPGQQTCCQRMSSCERSDSFSGWHGRM